MDKTLIKNKRAGEEIYSLVWFSVWIVVWLVVIIGVLKFYSLNIDVKQVEADILSEKILDCINENGVLIDDFFKEDFGELGIFNKCGLNQEIMKEDFYFKIVLDTTPKKIISGGNPGFEAMCGQKGENVPKCVPKKENILYDDGTGAKPIKIEVLTASNQKGKNVLAGGSDE